MADSSLRGLLLQAQNPDGGWGYSAGQPSWLEPTAWAALALHGDAAADRAYKLVRGWQNADGSARPCAKVDSQHWTAALLVTLAALRRDMPVVSLGVKYLMDTRGSESGPIMTLIHALNPRGNDREPKFEGWPWHNGAAAWIEPTVHGITALRLAKPLLPPDSRIDARIASAQDMIWHQRCQGGGWNYGARFAREVWLRPFPETTALALVGLLGRKGLGESIETARSLGANDPSSVTRAWLALSLRLHGQGLQDSEPVVSRDLAVCAISELGTAQGNWRLLAGRAT